MNGKQKANEEELVAQLEEWKAQVARYKAKAEDATAEAKDVYFEITGALQRMHDKAWMKLEELKLQPMGDEETSIQTEK
jgi:hypothetical protein